MVLSLFQNYCHKIKFAISAERGVTFVSAVILVAVMSLSIWASLVLSDVILKTKSAGTTESEMQIIANGLLDFYRDCGQFVTDTGSVSTDFLDLETQPLAARFEGVLALQEYRQGAWDGPYIKGGYDEDEDGDTYDSIQEYLNDAWNKPYIYDYSVGGTEATITSYGLNRAADGGDDIVVTVTAGDLTEEKIRRVKEELAYINARKYELESRYLAAGESWPPIGFSIDNLYSNYGAATIGLVSHWKMDESSWNGTASEVDDNAGSNDGTAYGGLTTDFKGKLGRCGDFDGTDDYVGISNVLNQPNLEQEWSVEAWVNIDDTSLSQILISGMNSGVRLVHGATDRLLLYLNSGLNDYYIYSNNTGLLTGQGWKHVAFVFRNSDAYRKIYVDGVDHSGSGPNLTSTPSGLSSTWEIGNQNVSGLIDEVRVWSRSLTPDDVFQEYLRGNYLTDWAYKYDEWQSEYAWDSGNDVFYSYGPDRDVGGDDDIYQSE